MFFSIFFHNWHGMIIAFYSYEIIKALSFYFMEVSYEQRKEEKGIPGS